MVLSAFTDELLYVDGSVVEECLSHVVHVVAQFGLDEVVGNHGVEHRSGKMNVIFVEHLEIVLQILSYFHNFGVLIQRFKYVYNFLRFFTIGRHSHIKRLFFFDREAQTHQFCVDRAC